MIAIKKQLLFFFYFLVSLAVYSQETIKIKGVINSYQGEAVTNANIIILDNSNGTTSNEKGEFYLNIKNQDKVKLVISHINYNKYTRTINPKKDTNIQVKMRNKVLKTLKVEYIDPGSSPTEILPTINASNMLYQVVI